MSETQRPAHTAVWPNMMCRRPCPACGDDVVESDLPRSSSYTWTHVIGLHRETGQWESVDSSGRAGSLEFWREHHNPAVWVEFKLARRTQTTTWSEVDDG